MIGIKRFFANLQCSLVQTLGIGVSTLLPVHISQTSNDPCVVWIERDRLFVIRDRMVVVLLVVVSAPTLGISPSIFRIKLDRLAEIGNRSVEIAFVVPDKPAL